MDLDHKQFMLKAVELSREHMQRGDGGPFGAVIVKNGKIIAEGWNMVTSSNDPTAHAEVVAIRKACQVEKNFSLDGCSIYTSCEPCPMCLAAIYWSRLDKIYYANTREQAAEIGFDDDFLYREIPKSIETRFIPTIRILPEEAWKVFQMWREKPDKIDY